jgi:hypothetical protein
MEAALSRKSSAVLLLRDHIERTAGHVAPSLTASHC